MLTSELIEQVRRIEIRTSRIVDELTGGAYHSMFKGRGIEFDEVREYTQEDDARDIDWNVTARMGMPFIKKFVEERELTVMLLVDVSASGGFGSGNKTKRQHAVEVAALLAFSAIRNNDRVGLLMFSDQVELHLPPRSGRSHVLRLIRELVAFQPARTGTDINAVLKYTMKVLDKRSVVFLISDMLDHQDIEKSLKITNRRHDLIAVRILDPLETAWPRLSDITLEGSENGELLNFSRKNQRDFALTADKFYRTTRKSCERARVDLIDMRCGDDHAKALMRFFRRRRRRG